jgi:nitrogen-specific signal transduction histidine kinase
MATKKILREHGGRITFRSRPGQGTTFVAKFPGREITENSPTQPLLNEEDDPGVDKD